MPAGFQAPCVLGQAEIPAVIEQNALARTVVARPNPAPAIVRFGGGYELVPREIAEKARQRDAGALVLMNDFAPTPEEDDAYADHPIPDDLMW